MSHEHKSLKATSTEQQQDFVNTEQIVNYASNQEIILSIKTLGPGFRAVARAKHNSTLIVGYCAGFIRPGGKILHIDEMKVFQKALEKARDENPNFRGGGTVFGVSLLLGGICCRHGYDSNCEIAEFLAIDDEDFQHKRLVRHFSRLGLKKIRYVGEDITSVPDRLVWGGCGTLMNANLKDLLTKWTPTFLD